MRSLAATIMSFGAIALAFGITTLAILGLAKWNSYHNLAGMTSLGMLAFIAGAALLALGFFMGRMGRGRDSRATEPTR